MAVLYFGERQQEEASNAMTRFKYAYVLNVMSDDHPGIVHRFKENRVRPYLMSGSAGCSARRRSSRSATPGPATRSSISAAGFPPRSSRWATETFSIFDLRFSIGSADFSHGVEGSATWESLRRRRAVAAPEKMGA
jgi:hypothetical protein